MINIKLVSLKSHKIDLCKYIKSDSQLLIFKITLDYLILASWLMQIGTGFSRDLWPHFRYCLLLPAMSFVRSLAKFERCCEFSKLRGGHTIDAQK